MKYYNGFFKPTGEFIQVKDYPIRDLDEKCGWCGQSLGEHFASGRCDIKDDKIIKMLGGEEGKPRPA